MKILVVDDSAMMRKLIARCVGSGGARDVEVVEAADGMQALAIIARHGPSIDLILCDMNMPNVDGLSLLRSLRGSPRPRTSASSAEPPPAGAARSADLRSARHIPFVIVTADESDESTARALREGAAGVIGKPFQPEVIADLVRRCRSHGRRATSGAFKTDTVTRMIRAMSRFALLPARAGRPSGPNPQGHGPSGGAVDGYDEAGRRLP